MYKGSLASTLTGGDSLEVSNDVLDLSLVHLIKEGLIVEILMERILDCLSSIIFPLWSRDVSDGIAHQASHKVLWNGRCDHVGDILDELIVVITSQLLSLGVLLHLGDVVVLNPIPDSSIVEDWRDWNTGSIQEAGDSSTELFLDMVACVSMIVRASQIVKEHISDRTIWATGIEAITGSGCVNIIRADLPDDSGLQGHLIEGQIRL